MATEGARVVLVSTTDPYTRLRPGATGTVKRVDGLGTLHVAWEDGSTLGLIPGEDEWHEPHTDEARSPNPRPPAPPRSSRRLRLRRVHPDHRETLSATFREVLRMTQITDRLAEADALAVYSELVIEAMAEAGMNDPTHDPDLPGWLVDRYDGVRVVDRQRYVMAIVNPDEERLRLVVTNLYGAEHVGLDFPATPIGLAMFVAAARAA